MPINAPTMHALWFWDDTPGAVQAWSRVNVTAHRFSQYPVRMYLTMRSLYQPPVRRTSLHRWPGSWLGGGCLCWLLRVTRRRMTRASRLRRS